MTTIWTFYVMAHEDPETGEMDLQAALATPEDAFPTFIIERYRRDGCEHRIASEDPTEAAKLAIQEHGFQLGRCQLGRCRRVDGKSDSPRTRGEFRGEYGISVFPYSVSC